MEQFKSVLSITWMIVYKVLTYTLILLRATMMFIYHIIAALRGWSKEERQRSHRPTTSPRHIDKRYYSNKATYTPVKQHTHQDSKGKGNAFEAYIAKAFPNHYYTVKEWRSDKYADGIYAESNMHPDLEIEYKHSNVPARFAVECKFRSRLHNDTVELAKSYQLENYGKYASEKRIPVFVALGLGGYASQPEELFIIPLAKIQSNVLRYQELQPFKINHQSYLLYDYQTQELR